MPHLNYVSVFDSIIRLKAWGSDESASGHGSTVGGTAILRRRLADAFAHLQIRSFVDAPCGDMNWMRHVEYKFDKYVGIDLVPRVINKLRKQTFPTAYNFQIGNIVTDVLPAGNFQIGNIVTDVLPAGDALFCRDCFGSPTVFGDSCGAQILFLRDLS